MFASLADTAQSVSIPHLDLGLEVLRPAFIRRNLDAFASHYAQEASGSLRARFLEALSRVVLFKYPFAPSSRRPHLIFSADEVHPTIVSDLLVLDQTPTDWEYPAGERAQVAAQTDAAWDLLERVDAHLADTLGCVAGAFLMARQNRYLGGSLSSHVGVMSFAPAPDWSTAEYASHILHECVHQILFVHDMLFGMFHAADGLLARPESLVTSTVLKRPRPYDRAYHSAFVAHAVHRFLTAVNAPGLIPASMDDIARTVSGLESKPNCLMPFGKRCLADLARANAAARAHHVA